jgi:nitrogen fixation protein FixH
MQSASTPATSAPRSWLWPAGIVALLSLHMLAMGVVVFIATRDPSFSVEPQAYKKAVAWDQSRAQHAASVRLGWSAKLQISGVADHLGRRRVTCRLTDERGIAVMAAEVKLEAFHHARASERLHVTMNPEPDGNYTVELPLRRAGNWEFRIAARRGTEQYDTVVTQVVGAGA